MFVLYRFNAVLRNASISFFSFLFFTHATQPENIHRERIPGHVFCYSADFSNMILKKIVREEIWHMSYTHCTLWKPPCSVWLVCSLLNISPLILLFPPIFSAWHQLLLNWSHTGASDRQLTHGNVRLAGSQPTESSQPWRSCTVSGEGSEVMSSLQAHVSYCQREETRGGTLTCKLFTLTKRKKNFFSKIQHLTKWIIMFMTSAFHHYHCLNMWLREMSDKLTKYKFDMLMKKMYPIYNWSNKLLIGDCWGLSIGHEQGFPQQARGTHSLPDRNTSFWCDVTERSYFNSHYLFLKLTKLYLCLNPPKLWLFHNINNSPKVKMWRLFSGFTHVWFSDLMNTVKNILTMEP